MNDLDLMTCRKCVSPNRTTEAHEPRVNNSPIFRAGAAVVGTVALASLLLGASPGRAVSPGEAQQLKTTLTPMGAERVGNKDGSIPAWTGGYTVTSPGYRAGTPRPDPFAGEKPLFAITAGNFEKYADRLPEGAKALFRKYPDSRMDIYPTHPSTAFPASVYA